MNFQSRSFVQTMIYRPKPVIHFDPDFQILVVLTPWGNGSYSETAVKNVKSYLSTATEDREATSPFKKVPSLSAPANALRTAMLLLNDQMHKTLNRKEYVEGYEIFMGIFRDNQFSFISYGQPHVLLQRNGHGTLPLVWDIDHAMDLNQESPIPKNLVGTQAYLELQVHTLKPHPQDKMILLSRNSIPKPVFQQANPWTLESLTKSLVTSDASSFWLGILDF